MLWSYLAVGLWQQKHIYNEIQVVWNGFHQPIATAVSQGLSYSVYTMLPHSILHWSPASGEHICDVSL